MKRPVVGLALGGGAARGWSHIGVIRALEQRGVPIDVVAGTSIGSLVGAAYVADYFEELEAWVRALKWRDVMALMDIRFVGGLIRGEKLFDVLREELVDTRIEDCNRPYAAVATNFVSGNEVWLREGDLLDAVRASVSLPGLFAPIQHQGRWLVDGGLVNPVPVSLCRAMGADIVIAVELNSDLLERHRIDHPRERVSHHAVAGTGTGRWSDRLGELMKRLSKPGKDEKDRIPSVLEVMARSNTIMSVRITRSRMAGDPPDILLSPRLAHISLMDFHRASESIPQGYAEVERKAQQLEYLGL